MLSRIHGYMQLQYICNTWIYCMQLPWVKTNMKAKQLSFSLLPDVPHRYVYTEYFIHLYTGICVKCYIPPITNIIWCEGTMEVKMMLLTRKKINIARALKITNTKHIKLKVASNKWLLTVIECCSNIMLWSLRKDAESLE